MCTTKKWIMGCKNCGFSYGWGEAGRPKCKNCCANMTIFEAIDTKEIELVKSYFLAVNKVYEISLLLKNKKLRDPLIKGVETE